MRVTRAKVVILKAMGEREWNIFSFWAKRIHSMWVYSWLILLRMPKVFATIGMIQSYYKISLLELYSLASCPQIQPHSFFKRTSVERCHGYQFYFRKIIGLISFKTFSQNQSSIKSSFNTSILYPCSILIFLE